jgi:putative SOS response-associated peptidase YedK
MCGRATYKLTWEEIVRLYQLTLDQPARNTQARYNVCPAATIDTIVARLAEIHDRMPVLLTEQDYEPWLCGVAGTELADAAYTSSSFPRQLVIIR